MKLKPADSYPEASGPMVYTELHIVSGLLLSREQIIIALKTLAKVSFDDMEESDIDEELPDLFVKHFIKPDAELFRKHGGAYPTLFGFPCCSKSRGKWYLLGYNVHTYYRRHVQCKDCGDHSVCEKCIGETNNGWYDVDDIFEEPTRILREKVCRFCHADQVESNRRCKCCFRNNPSMDHDSLSNQEMKMERFAKDTLQLIPGTYVIAPYYLLNDCLSCT